MLHREMDGANLKNDRSGGIEGLPLQLMILILIATLATAIIIGWMGNISTPESIGDVTLDKSDVSAVRGANGYCTITETFSVYVTDQDDNPLKDAVITLSGHGIQDAYGNTVHKNTDKDGKVTFNKNSMRLKMSSNTGFVTVNVSKPGYGEDSSCKIIVIV